MGCVYMIICEANKKQYIGKHSGTNLRRYFKHNLSRALANDDSKPKLYRAIRKYGPAAFRIFPLIQAAEESVLFGWEKYYIQEFETQAYGYNISAGGEGASRPCSEETKQKIRSANLGIGKGKKHPPDCNHCAWLRANRSKLRLKSFMPGSTPWNKGMLGWKPKHREQHWSEESRQAAAERARNAQRDRNEIGQFVGN